MQSSYPKNSSREVGAIAFLGVFAALAAVPSNAAENRGAEASPAEPQLEEVVVSGLRAERLQDTAMAVSVVSADTLVNVGFKDPKDLQFISPSIQVSLVGANAIYIRGSGTNSQNGGTEQSVGMVIDGVVQGFVDDIGGDVSDLDHVEVFRGPQGTQFAKNASAGVVSMLTRKPVLGASGWKANVSYGEHDDSSNSVTVNLPISSTMAARITGGYQYRDGVYENPVRNQSQGAREQKSIRGRFLWEPGDSTSLLATVDYRDTFEQPNFTQAWAHCGPEGPVTPYVNQYGTNRLPPCNGAVTAGVPFHDTNDIIVESDPAYRRTEAGGASLQIDHDIGDYRFTSISAWRMMDRRLLTPSGQGVIPIGIIDNDYWGDQYSQEFRFTSPADRKLTYVGGVFYYLRDTINEILRAGEYFGEAYYKYPNTPYGADVMISQEGGRTRYRNKVESYAAFIDGAFHFTDRFQLNGGFRATRDDVFGGVTMLDTPGVYPFTVGAAIKPDDGLSVKNTGYTYRFGPQFFLTPYVQLFATYAHGYKGPLVDNVVEVATEVLPEEVDMFEAGIKSQFLDRRLTVNLTAYHQKFEDYQVVLLNGSRNPVVFQLGNAGGLRSQGFELETQFAPDDHWTLGGALVLNDAEYTDFLTRCWDSREPIKQPTTGPNGCFVRPGQTSASSNAEGTPLTNSSKWTYRLNVGYNTVLLNGYEIDSSATWQHRTSFLSQPMDPNLVIPGYGVLNLTVGVTTPGGRFRVGAFARNALDEFFLAGRLPVSGGWTNVLNPEAVRTVGMTMSMNFE